MFSEVLLLEIPAISCREHTSASQSNQFWVSRSHQWGVLANCFKKLTGTRFFRLRWGRCEKSHVRAFAITKFWLWSHCKLQRWLGAKVVRYFRSDNRWLWIWLCCVNRFEERNTERDFGSETWYWISHWKFNQGELVRSTAITELIRSTLLVIRSSKRHRFLQIVLEWAYRPTDSHIACNFKTWKIAHETDSICGGQIRHFWVTIWCALTKEWCQISLE